MSDKQQWTIETLKERFDNFLAEREQRYMEMFKSSKEAVSSAFAASEKAIEKSDIALKEYKTNANEIRAALNDWQKNMISRNEEKVDVELLRTLIENQDKIISSLQISFERSQGLGEGTSITQAQNNKQRNFFVALIVNSILSIGTLIIILLKK